MSKARMAYFEKDDVLHLAISDEAEAGSVEVSPNITAELNAKGELIGIEILRASSFVRDSVLDSVQAKMLDLTDAKTASVPGTGNTTSRQQNPRPGRKRAAQRAERPARP
jgi:uncharacterized protein YuzE